VGVTTTSDQDKPLVRCRPRLFANQNKDKNKTRSNS
jgi:hypothetical protein